MLDKTLLDVIVCPHCKGPLEYKAQDAQLICKTEQLAYPVRDGIPVLLTDEAIDLNEAPELNMAQEPAAVVALRDEDA